MITLYITQAHDLIGKPYESGARGPDRYDCWGLCVEVYRRGGIALPDWHADHLTRTETKKVIEGYTEDNVDWITTPESWCFVYCRVHGHIGLYINGSVLHSARKLGVVLQRMENFEMIYRDISLARWRAC